MLKKLIKKPAVAAKKPAAKAVAAKAPARKGFPARKPGSKPAAKRAANPSGPRKFPAPSDFKPASIDIRFATSPDGLLSSATKFKVERIRGKWDNPEAKRFDMMEYDAHTVVVMFARMQAMLFAANIEKRLTPKTKFRVVLRVTKRKADDALAVRVIAAGTLGASASGKPKWMWFSMDKNVKKESIRTDAETGKKMKVTRMIIDPVFSKIRRSAKHLAGAFVNIQLLPSLRKTQTEEE